MAYQTYDAHVGSHGVFARIADWFADRAARLDAHRAEQQRIAELGALDARTLRDIGLSVAEISSVAHNPADVTRIR
jgi:uncharacterized protein YjiS (DUF1127 family)